MSDTLSTGNSRKVRLLVGPEQIALEEEIDFLVDVSCYFEGMFNPTHKFAENFADEIALEDFDGASMKLILQELHEAKNGNGSMEERISKILNAITHRTLDRMMIKIDLEGVLFTHMEIGQMMDCEEIAIDTENIKLRRYARKRLLNEFGEFSKTKAFRQLTLTKLTEYLGSKFLRYEAETQVFEAIFWWLEFDFAGREVHIKELLALINWKEIDENLLSQILVDLGLKDKMPKLANICATFLNSQDLNGNRASKVMKLDKCLSSAGVQRDNSVMVMFTTRFCLKSRVYVVAAIYDLENDRFEENIYFKEKYDLFGPKEFEICDGMVYAFGHDEREVKIDGETRASYSIDQCSVNRPNDWTTVGWYGESCSAAVYISQHFPDMQPDEEKINQEKTENDRKAFLQNLIHDNSKCDQKALDRHPQRALDLFRGKEVHARRSADGIYIFHIGCDKLDTNRGGVKNVWDRDRWPQVRSPKTFLVEGPLIYVSLDNGFEHEVIVFDSRDGECQIHRKTEPLIRKQVVVPTSKILATTANNDIFLSFCGERFTRLDLSNETSSFPYTWPQSLYFETHVPIFQFRRKTEIQMVMIEKIKGVRRYEEPLDQIKTQHALGAVNFETGAFRIIKSLGNLSEKLSSFLSGKFKTQIQCTIEGMKNIDLIDLCETL